MSSVCVIGKKWEFILLKNIFLMQFLDEKKFIVIEDFFTRTASGNFIGVFVEIILSTFENIELKLKKNFFLPESQCCKLFRNMSNIMVVIFLVLRESKTIGT